MLTNKNVKDQLADILTISEVILISKCKQGDIKSYELLYNRYCHAMYHTCLRIVADKHDAEDILQEAFLEAFTRLGTLKNAYAFGGWLKQIVVHKSINFIKRSKAAWQTTELPGDYDLRDEEQINEQEFARQAGAVIAAINVLPVKYRTILNLHVFEKMGFEEIARTLEMPSATVRSQYLRAKQKIIAVIVKP